MKPLYAIVICIFWASAVVNGQSSVAQKITTMESSFAQPTTVKPFERLSANDTRSPNNSQIVSDAQLLLLKPEILNQLNRSAPETITMNLPVSAKESMQLLLYRVDIFSPDFSLFRSSDRARSVPYNSGHHYRGIVKGDMNSVVAMSFFENEIMGMIGTDAGNMVIGKTGSGYEGVYIIYNDKNLLNSSTFECRMPDDGGAYTLKELENNQQRDPGDCVTVYIEINDDIVDSKGGVINVTNFVTGIFNQSFVIYANENITMSVSEILAWDTPSPYSGLSSFQAFTDSVNGDIGHLVAHASYGVAASIGGLCSPNPDLTKCFSGIGNYYEFFPVYSWTVKVVTHEMGHILGSRHTHACVWNGDGTAIDGCAGYTEGDCPLPGLPPEGGTIMSYCSNADFNLGFGPQPGNVIRNKIEEAGNCLNTCQPTGPDDAGIIDIISPNRNVCGTTIVPEILLRNFGTNTLESVAIYYFMDDETPRSINWSGALSSGVTDTVPLPQLSFEEGSHALTVYTEIPNGVADSKSTNDMRAETFGSGTHGLTLTIILDDYTSETTWNIQNTTDDIVAIGGSYYAFEDGAEVVETICVPQGCLRFTIYDAQGDGICCGFGEGSYTLVDNASGEILASGGEFGSFEKTLICPPIQGCIDQDTFPDNLLTHQGPCSSSTTKYFTEDTDFRSFTISDIGQKLNVPPDGRYIDLVTVSYMMHSGESVVYGVYSGTDNLDKVEIEILRSAESVTVSLENDWNSNKEVSISISPMTFCRSETDCPDDDGDGICNSDDICPGGNDNVDFDKDGLPDGCDNCPHDANPGQEDSNGDGTGDACEFTGCSNFRTSYLSPKSLAHAGTGASISTLDFGMGNKQTDIAFNISGIDQNTNDTACLRYIEEVVIKVDAQFFGRFSGSQVSSAEVFIPGPAQTIEVVLFDSYDGDVPEDLLSIDISPVSSCADGSGPLFEWSDESGQVIDPGIDAHVYPNPSTGKGYVEFTQAPTYAKITVRDILGRIMTQKQAWRKNIVELDLSNIAREQILFVTIEVDGLPLRTIKLMLVE
jgi:Metallo-peptidase family M12